MIKALNCKNKLCENAILEKSSAAAVFFYP